MSPQSRTKTNPASARTRIRDLETEVADLRLRYETQRQEQITFLNALRRDAFDLTPLERDTSDALLKMVRADMALILPKIIRVATGTDEGHAKTNQEQRYLELR